jgi:signal transduction histidine kinase
MVPKNRTVLMEKDILRPMRRLMAPHARKRNVRLSDIYSFDLVPALFTDPELMSIIFYNLLDNAIKYSFEGTEITIFGSQTREEYLIAVSNKAPAIKPEEIDKVFDRGYRGKNVRKKEVGLGLGLSVARDIAESLGCHLELASPGGPDKEVVFRLRIPKEIRG